jgi:dihydroneopterin aldolase
MSEIILENMEFHAFHGCMEHEKNIGNTFLVTVKLKIDTTQAGISDNLDDTLNYQLVYDVIRAQMAIRSNLIEHLARRIIDAIMDQFDQIKSVKLKLTKLNPPLGAKVESVSIKLESKRKKHEL